MECGAARAGAKLGAVGERISKHGGGWSVDTTDPVATLAQIRHIVTHPTVYEEMIQAVEAIQTPTVEEMTDAYRAFMITCSAQPTGAANASWMYRRRVAIAARHISASVYRSRTNRQDDTFWRCAYQLD